MIYIIIISILVLPWLVIPSNIVPEPTRLIKASVFDVAMMGIIVFALIDGLKVSYKNKYLGWISAWIFFTFVCNWYYPLLRGIGYNAGTIESSLHFIFALTGTIFVCSNIERNDFIRIAKAVAISATLVSAFSLLQVIGLDPLKTITKIKVIPGSADHRIVAALLDHPDLLGNYLAISLPFFFYLRGTRYLISMFLVIFILIFVKSSISILAAFAAFFVFMFLKNRDSNKWRNGLLVGFVCLSLFVFFAKGFNKINTGFTGRTPVWHEMINRMSNPAFGQGLGVVKSLNVITSNQYWMFAHNDYVEIYCCLGALGLFLFFLIVINSFRNFNYRKDNLLGFSFLASFVAFLIIMFGSFPMEIAPLALGGMLAFWGVEKIT